MDYELRSYLTSVRDSLLPVAKSYLVAKRDEATANTALLEAQLVEQEYRNKNERGYTEYSFNVTTTR